MFEQFEKFNSTQKEQFSEAANKLLSNSFVMSSRQQDKNDYYFISRHQHLFEAYFKMSGWELIIDRNLNIAQLINSYSKNRYRFTLIESIVLVTIRLIYHLKRQELSLSDDVVFTIGELQDQLARLNISDKPMGKTEIRNIFRTLKKYNIVHVLGGDVASVDTKILVYPSIIKIVQADDISALNKKLEEYKSGGEDDENIEENKVD
jgi:hypothetical protein